jgi:hypothetical protein
MLLMASLLLPIFMLLFFANVPAVAGDPAVTVVPVLQKKIRHFRLSECRIATTGYWTINYRTIDLGNYLDYQQQRH